MESVFRIIALSAILGILALADIERRVPPSEMYNRRLVYMEDELISMSNFLIHTERFEKWSDDDENITKFKSFLEKARVRNDYTRKHISDYTQTATGAYLMTKRLFKEWTDIKKVLVNHPLFIKEIREKFDNIFKAIPDEDDLNESKDNVLHLQRIYGLKTEDLAEGKIFKNKTTVLLTLEDCEHLAEKALANEDYLTALDWYKYIAKVAAGKPELKRFLVPAYVRMGSIYYRNRHYEKAIEFAEKALKSDPTSRSANSSLGFYRTIKGGGEKIPFKPIQPSVKLDRLYNKICGGKLSKKPKVVMHPDYYCYLFRHYRRGYIFDKVEYAHRNPDILYFHKVVNPRLLRKLVGQLNTTIASTVFSDTKGYRNERHWAILPDDGEFSEDLDAMFTQLTAVDYKLSSATHLAINFAPGVTNEPYIDLINVGEQGENSTTFIIFMNDVDFGGNIIFPWLKLSVQPEKGSALFFYNTRPDYLVNRKLQWAVCPVVVGHLWMAHKIYEEHPFEQPKFGNLIYDLWSLY